MIVATRFAVVVAACALVVGCLGGCDKSGDTPGQKLDKALDKTGDEVKKAGDAIKPK